MARKDFHRELDQLVEEVVSLGSEVEPYPAMMVNAMECWDIDAGGVPYRTS